MYLDYFGLAEAPFSITPDPSFIYMSGRHRNALAHLLHGVGQGGGGGFVQLTGEVGTGKTTLCRALLEQVPPGTHIALVLNPLMNPVEMLAAICEELGISTDGIEGSPKALVDSLNAFLLAAHERGERVVLVIDEAQNLSIEALEQVRLLTNLETSKEKLLQIILLGQPELREMLQRRSLRQLAQRITARYHLTPLEAEETARYVGHRLSVAGSARNPFTRSALKALHQRSQGVPRLVNIIADRAMTGAFAKEQDKVDARLVHEAADEVQLGEPRVGWRGSWPKIAIAAVAASLVLTIGWFAGQFFSAERDSAPAMAAEAQGKTVPVTARASVPEQRMPDVASEPINAGPAPNLPGDTSIAQENLVSPPVTGAAAASSPETASLTTDEPASLAAPAEARRAPDEQWFELQDLRAWQGLAERWGRGEDAALLQASCLGREGLGFACLEDQGNWLRIRELGVPVILVLQGSEVQHVLLSGMDGNDLIIGTGSSETLVSRYDIEPRWYGTYLVAWPQAADWPREIGQGDTGEPVDRVLDLATRTTIPYAGPGRFDQGFEDWLKGFQLRNGLEPDGIVGPQTLLYLMRHSIDEPRFLSSRDFGN